MPEQQTVRQYQPDPNLTRPDQATAVILARLEGKLDSALIELRGNLADQGRRIGATEQAIAAIDVRARVLETGTAVLQATVDEVRQAATRNQSRLDELPSSTRANVTVTVAALSLLLAVIGLVVSGAGGPA